MRREDDLFVYHVMMRGLKGCCIFNGFWDKIKFLVLLNVLMIKYGTVLYGFVLMDTHVHLLIRCENLDALCLDLFRSYTGYYVSKYKKRGCGVLDYPPLIYEKKRLDWQIDTLLYIMNNPVMAGLCKSAGGFYFSSYAFYTKKKTRLSHFITIDASLVSEHFETLKDFKHALEVKRQQEEQLLAFK